MSIIRITDHHNPSKIWVIKKYAKSEFFWNQEISGKLHYPQFRRSSKRWIISVLGNVL